MDILELEVFPILLPFLNPQNLCVWMRTCKRNWSSVACHTHGGTIDRYWRKYFFKFIHGNFGWVIGQCYDVECSTPLNPLSIRASITTPIVTAGNTAGTPVEQSLQSAAVYGKVEQISTGVQLWTGSKYSYTVSDAVPAEANFAEQLLARSSNCNPMSASYTSRGNVCTGGTTPLNNTGAVPGGYRSWRDACSDVSQRALLDRDCKRGFAKKFEFKTENWIRLNDAALTTAVTQHVQREGNNDNLVDLAFYRREPTTHSAATATPSSPPTAHSASTATPSSPPTARSVAALLATKTRLGSSSCAVQAARDELPFNEEGVVQRSFEELFISPTRMPILARAAIRSASALYLLHGPWLVAAQAVRHKYRASAPPSLRGLMDRHNELLEEFRRRLVSVSVLDDLDVLLVSWPHLTAQCGPPVLWEDSARFHTRLLEDAMHRAGGGSMLRANVEDYIDNDLPAAINKNCHISNGDKGYVIEKGSLISEVLNNGNRGVVLRTDVVRIAFEWRMYCLEQLRLAVLRRCDFLPYADGTIWVMRWYEELWPKYGVQAKTEHSADELIAFMGPHNALVMRFCCSKT